MTTTTDGVLTVHELLTLAAIVDAGRAEVPVTWMTVSGDIKTGVIRPVQLPPSGDVRQAEVRVSATFEWLWPIADVVAMVQDGSMALDYRP
jgi:hypothetical protein